MRISFSVAVPLLSLYSLTEASPAPAKPAPNPPALPSARFDSVVRKCMREGQNISWKVANEYKGIYTDFSKKQTTKRLANFEKCVDEMLPKYWTNRRYNKVCVACLRVTSKTIKRKPQTKEDDAADNLGDDYARFLAESLKVL